MNAEVTSPPLPSGGSSRLRALALLMAVFVLGAASGIGGGLLVLRGVAQRVVTGRFAHSSAPVDWVISTLEREIGSELDLTDSERAAIHEELRASSIAFRRIRAGMMLQSRQEVRATLSRIEKHLPPEKQKQLQDRAGRRLRPWGLLE